MLNSVNSANICGFGRLDHKKPDIMQTLAENTLNPFRYYLSSEAKKRLRWMYAIKYDFDNNISLSAKNLGVSRTWLSQIYNNWKYHNYDPRSLEPRSKAPINTNNRKKIEPHIQNEIILTRLHYRTWGKDKISSFLHREKKINVGSTTVNRYLQKNNLINLKLSNKNKHSYANKKNRDKQTKFKMRPPKEIKDYKPGALVEKDVKLVAKPGAFINQTKHRAKGNFHYQHTFIDSFTRIRIVGLTKNLDSSSSVLAFKESKNRWPFPIACFNNDNGGENHLEFENYLEQNNIFQFFSRVGTPTDNPRVERSHLTDDIEFYNQGNVYNNFEKQKEACLEWERIYNYERPHQALGQLTPMQFYFLWKKNPKQAYSIVDKYQGYLKRQRKRQANSRRMRTREQIVKLMQIIDLNLKKQPINKC